MPYVSPLLLSSAALTGSSMVSVLDENGQPITAANPFPIKEMGSNTEVPAIGYERITDLTIPTALALPTGATWARVYVEVGSIYFRDDGIVVSTSDGSMWSAGAYFETYAPAAVSIIQDVAGSIIRVEYH